MNKLSKWKLHRLLSQHEELKDERNPMFERNRFVKYMAWFMVIYYAAIMVLLGVVLPLPMSEVYYGVAAYHVLDGFFYTILVADFWLRFVMQETPAMQARPYSLLPISRTFLMRRYLVRAGLSLGNLFWGFFLVPFALICVMRGATLLSMTGWLLGWWLLIVANSYLYIFFRALSTRHIAWSLIPLLLHAAVLCIAFLPKHNPIDMPCTLFMYAFARWQLWPFALMALIVILLFVLNLRTQGSIIYDEVGKKEDVEMKSTAQMNWLNRFGIVGEYLKLELRMKLRNRMMKIQFFVLLGLMALLSCILYFTQIYDNPFMKSFICLYNYLVPGMQTLVVIMCHEGNYMDMLMSRKESILDLLTAKYYFYSALLLLPFCMIIPLCVIGKITIWMSLGYFFFTIGLLYPMMFQMARFNKETLPLNAKLTGKQGNTAQNIISMVLIFAPIAIERLSVVLLGDVWGYVLLIVLGSIGVITHRQWLRYTYNQFMQRRYVNMEGFRATRK